MTADTNAANALRTLFPPGVAVACSFDPAVGDGSDSGRSAESRAARVCARQALARLGHGRVDIPTGYGGQPIWPHGLAGSLSHCPGLQAAAVASVRVVRSIGVDVELNRPLRGAVAETVFSESERKSILRLASRHTSVAWSAVMWSAKESVFKAWYPLTHRWIDFTGCEVTIDPDRGTVSASVTRARGAEKIPDAPLTFGGGWTTVGHHILTAVTVPLPQGAPPA